MRSRQSTISTGSSLPREDPRIVPPAFVNFRDLLRIQVQHVQLMACDEARIPVPEPVNVLHPVNQRKRKHQPANHIVQPRTQPPARDNARPRLRRIEKEMPPRSGQLKRRHFLHRHFHAGQPVPSCRGPAPDHLLPEIARPGWSARRIANGESMRFTPSVLTMVSAAATDKNRSGTPFDLRHGQPLHLRCTVFKWH